MTDFPTVWPEQAIITHTRNTRGRDLVTDGLLRGVRGGYDRRLDVEE